MTQALQMAPRADEVAGTRVRLKAFAERHLTGRRLGDFELAVGEVLANSVMHGDRVTPIDITIATQGRVRVEVTSYGRSPAPLHASRRREGGFGLHMVAQLADRWALETNGSTCVMVCFEL